MADTLIRRSPLQGFETRLAAMPASARLLDEPFVSMVDLWVNPAGPGGDEFFVGLLEPFIGVIEKHQPAAVDARDVRGEQFGVGARGGHTGGGQACRCGRDRLPQLCRTSAAGGRGHDCCCSRACLSAVPSASSSASMSPSSTWSRLCALKLMRWSAIRFSGKL